MSIKVQGKEHKTIADAASHWGVSTKTVREWISAGIISSPQTVQQGLRTIKIFPNDYLAKADKQIKKHIEEKEKETVPKQ